MSQIAKLFDGTASTDIETITGDVGGAVGPNAAFNINLVSGDGLTVTGIPAANTLGITLDGYTIASAQTIGAASEDIITIPMGAVPGTMFVEVKCIGFESTTPVGCGYNVLAAFRTTGAAASVIGVIDKYVAEEVALIGGDIDVLASGNDIVVRVFGVIGLTIDWKASLHSLGV